MKFYMHNIFKSILVLAASAFAFTSCLHVEEGMAEAEGHLCAPALDVDVTVEDLMQTRAIDFFVDAPDFADVHFIVKDKDETVKYDAKGLWETIPMPVGKYSVEASCGSNGFGQPYFTAKTAEDASIEPQEEEKPVLNMALANALLKVEVPADFATHFTLETVTLTAPGFEPVVLTAAEIADWYYVPSGVALSVRLSGKNSAGVATTFEPSAVTLAAKSARTIVCGSTALATIQLPDQSAGAWAGRLYVTPATVSGEISAENLSKLVYEVSTSATFDGTPATAEVISGDYRVFKGLANGTTYNVRARIGNLVSNTVSVTVSEDLPGAAVSSVHYNDAGGNLAGTNSTLSVGLSGILKTLNDAGLLQLSGFALSSGSNVLRTADAAGAMTQASGWPFIPAGSTYALTIKHKLSDESDWTSSINSGISVPAPSFTVSLTNSYCSYDEYSGSNGIAKNVGNANSRNAETIYNVGASWKIAPELMSNGNYTKEARIILDGNRDSRKTTPSSNSYSVGNIAGNSWAAHTLVAEVTFAGTTQTSATKTHHITGLPHVSNPPTAEGGWKNAGDGVCSVKWNADHVEFSTSGSSKNPGVVNTFHIPSDIAVSVNSRVRVDGIKVVIWYNNEYMVKIGSSKIISQGSEKQKGKIFETSGAGTMTASANTISCLSDRKTTGYPVQVYNLYVKYR